DEKMGQSVKARILKYIGGNKRPSLFEFDEGDIDYITQLSYAIQIPRRVGILRKRMVFYNIYPVVVFSPDGDVYVQSKAYAQQIGGGKEKEVEIRAAARLIHTGDGVKKEIKVYVKGELEWDGLRPRRRWERASVLERSVREDIEKEKVTIVKMGKTFKIRE
ncbi:MAG: hypothetical protein ACE5KE_05335, partial [Methanosarcinales archaeon]